jgi:hypothetical protein
MDEVRGYVQESVPISAVSPPILPLKIIPIGSGFITDIEIVFTAASASVFFHFVLLVPLFLDYSCVMNVFLHQFFSVSFTVDARLFCAFELS